MTTWARAAIAAAAISCCGVMTAATAAADRPDYDLSHHPAPAVAPGVGIRHLQRRRQAHGYLHRRMARPRQQRPAEPAHRTLRRWRRRQLLQQDQRFPSYWVVHPP